MARPYSRIFVTGMGGFVGPWLAASLSARFPNARLVKAHFRLGDKSSEHIQLDVRDAEAVDRAIAGFAPDGVVHLAAISQVHDAQQSARSTFEVNLGGTMNIAEAMRRHVPGALLLFVSSGEVYGASFLTARAPVDEHAAVEPIGVYAASKAAAELFVAEVGRQGLRVIRLRPFNHIGPGQSDRFVVASFVAQIVEIELGRQEPVLHVGNLDAKRDFLDVRDVVAAYVEAMASERLESGAILNIASGEARRVGDVLESLLKKAKVPIRTVADPARFRPVDIQATVGDARLARALLDWAPKIPFEQTLTDMLDAQRAKSVS
jgi:GDP-4-dehydro-6-deoxy-D-mannose reductase